MAEGVGHEGVKPQRAIFIRDGRIITTGFTKRSERLYAIRDPVGRMDILRDKKFREICRPR